MQPKDEAVEIAWRAAWSAAKRRRNWTAEELLGSAWEGATAGLLTGNAEEAFRQAYNAARRFVEEEWRWQRMFKSKYGGDMVRRLLSADDPVTLVGRLERHSNVTEALATLSRNEAATVLLMVGYGETREAVAQHLGCHRRTVTKYLHDGWRRLHDRLGLLHANPPLGVRQGTATPDAIKRRAAELEAEGCSKQQIATRLGVRRSTVCLWAKERKAVAA